MGVSGAGAGVRIGAEGNGRARPPLGVQVVDGVRVGRTGRPLLLGRGISLAAVLARDRRIGLGAGASLRTASTALVRVLRHQTDSALELVASLRIGWIRHDPRMLSLHDVFVIHDH